MSLDELRRRYPWPEEQPRGRGECSGWFAGANRTALQAAMQPGHKVIVELGSWEGLSARWFCENMPRGATLICIDHWEGSSEHHRRPDWAERLELLPLTFLDNLWEHRARVIPMRTTTLAGMDELASLKIVPDVLYVDAGHEEEFVLADVGKALELWGSEDTAILGDDWPHTSVRRGVVRAATRCKLLSVYGASCWEILKGEPGNRNPPLAKDNARGLGG